MVLPLAINWIMQGFPWPNIEKKNIYIYANYFHMKFCLLFYIRVLNIQAFDNSTGLCEPYTRRTLKENFCSSYPIHIYFCLS